MIQYQGIWIRRCGDLKEDSNRDTPCYLPLIHKIFPYLVTYTGKVKCNSSGEQIEVEAVGYSYNTRLVCEKEGYSAGRSYVETKTDNGIFFKGKKVNLSESMVQCTVHRPDRKSRDVEPVTVWIEKK
jgi:hypothetical protein